MRNFTLKLRSFKNDILCALCFFTVFLYSMTGVFYVKGQDKTVLDKVVRLHVIANSDSDADQRVKLIVRDGITRVTSELFADCRDIDSAKKAAENGREKILSAARKALSENGMDYGAELKTGIETYPVRTYGDFVFPAGDYFSVRVILGEGKGKNWWCVLFPPLCTSGAVMDTDEGKEMFRSFGFTENEVNELVPDGNGEDKTEVKFKLSEIFKELCGAD